MSLSSQQKAQFLQEGCLKIASGLSTELMQSWVEGALQRLGYDKTPQNLEPIIWMNHHHQAPIKQIAPAAWEAICEIVGGEDRIETKILGIESRHFTRINSLVWSDAFIVNFSLGADQPWRQPQAEGFNWHKDGSYFRHFCDSREKALLLVLFWNDVEHQGGGTFIAADSPKHVAQKLLEHPDGIEPKTFDFPAIIQKCHDFRELVGKAGDLYIIHPYMLHASSANHSGRPRVMSNPPVVLKEPLRLDQNRSDLSLLEETTLRFLGTNFTPPPESARVSYWWEVT